MSRPSSILATLIISLFAVLLALQLRDPDSVLMRYLHSRQTAARLITHRLPFALQFSSTTAAGMSAQKDPSTQATSDQEGPVLDENGQPLGLPPPASGDGATKLDLSSGSDTVKLDHLGPLVVNKDGTLSRISNWDKMTEQEKRSTLKILGKRNQLRTDALKAEERKDKQ